MYDGHWQCDCLEILYDNDPHACLKDFTVDTELIIYVQPDGYLRTSDDEISQVRGRMGRTHKA